MRALIRWALILGLVWSGYWYAASYALRQGVATWFETQASRGWQAEVAGIESSGYPRQHLTLLAHPTLADPATGVAWRADWLLMESPAIWPGSQTVRFPETVQRLSYFDETAQIAAQDMAAVLKLEPNPALTLSQLALTAGPWAITGKTGLVLAAQSLDVSMVAAEAPETYLIDFDADALELGALLRGLIHNADSLPASFETLKMQMQVRFDQEWDRSALEERRPQPVAIGLKLAEAHWGGLRVLAAGDVTVDAAGVPTGTIAVKAENWREILAMAQASGVLPAPLVDPVTQVLSMLAGLSGSADALDVKLSLRNGGIALGPLPLGPAPRIVLR